MIDLENGNGSASDGRLPSQDCIVPDKMLGPDVDAWVKKAREFPDSGSMPDKLGPLCRLHRAHAHARLSSVGIPPCCTETMWSNWNGSSAIASGRWQYSQRNPARRRSVSFSDASIQPINSIVHAGLRARLALLFKLMRADSMARYSSNSRSSTAVS